MTRLSNVKRLARAYAKAPRRLGSVSLRALSTDPGPEKAIAACRDWLLASQAGSLTADGGSASHYDLLTGWASSYPETTGYVVPTLFALADQDGAAGLIKAARTMLDWLVSIQMEDGAFQGGNVDATPRQQVVFNTGQILFGLAEGAKRFGAPYEAAAVESADWLCAVQDPDGAWRRWRSPFTSGGPKTYEAHVAWALVEADRVFPGRGYDRVAMRHADWVLTRQKENGWFEDCGLGGNENPITHTIGYTMRGLFEVWRACGHTGALEGARRAAEALCPLVDDKGFLPGRLDREWRAASSTACVTGSAQIAHTLILLAAHENPKLRQSFGDTAARLNAFVRRTIQTHGPDGVRGGVPGSFPIWGDYSPFRYLNWAAKFTIDSNLAEIAAGRGL